MKSQDEIREILNGLTTSQRRNLAAEIGRTNRQIDNIRSGKSGMQATTFLKLCEALKGKKSARANR